MGYTHYIVNKKVSDEKFEEFSNACKKLYENLPEKTNSAGGYFANDKIEIAGWDGNGKPEFTKEFVSFNGKGEELSHETFYLENKEGFSFCKTARKPYDLLVVACYLATMQILGSKFSSDGFLRDGTCDYLNEGIDFYNEVMKPKIPITQKILWEQYLKD